MLGVWVIVFLFLGFPSDWEKILAVVSGLLIIVVAYTLPAPTLSLQKPEMFTENKQQ